MIQRQLAVHKQTRNLVLASGLILLIVGACFSFRWPLALGYLLVNGYAYAIMGWDKSRAKKGGFRMPEASLLLVAALGGGAGIALGMLVYRHKTRHLSFLILAPLFCALQLFLLISWLK